jgi:hypothetical protein
VEILSFVRFRLAALYCNEIEKLRRQTAITKELLDLVACLPDQPYNFYDRILESVSDNTLRSYLTRALVYLLVSREVRDTDLVAFGAWTYPSWYRWFGNFIEKPINCEDILIPLNELITMGNMDSRQTGFMRSAREILEPAAARNIVLVKLAHFSVAEYLRLATT